MLSADCMRCRRPGCFALPSLHFGRTRRLAAGLGLLGALATGPAVAQEGSTAAPPLGFVTVESATVSGALEVTGDKAVVRGGGVITARDHTAALELNRGGTVDVCATSSLHVTAGSAVMARPPLLLALDRGAMEIHMNATARDVLITPDLRFSVADDGPLDLRVRVTPNGDTCVEHKGLQAPKLEIVDAFGDGHYELRAGQHVLFEHGSLREVVDRETSPCGCPEVPVVSVASGGATGARPAAPGAAVGAAPASPETQHPFPAAESEGLTTESAAAAKVPATPPGVPHAQVAATLAYGAAGSSDGTGALPGAGTSGTESGTPAATSGDAAAAGAPAATSSGGGAAAASSAPVPATGTATGAVVGSGKATDAGSVSTGRAEAPAAPAPPGANDLAHRIGHFFRKIFGGS